MIIVGIFLAVAALVYLQFGRHPSMRDEERELRTYFRKRDAAEKRGEKFPPDQAPDGRIL